MRTPLHFRHPFVLCGAVNAQALETVDEVINNAISPISAFISGIIFYSI